MNRIPVVLFACAFMFCAVSSTAQQPALANLKVNQQRIESRISELSKFGRDSVGRGYRVAYTKGDQEGRGWYIDLMKKAGLDVHIDEAGNIIGKRKGKSASAKPIAFGSHLDMVPDGGNYDGCVGSISALELIEVLNENKIVTNHPLELIIFSNEEGGTIGSSAIGEDFDKEELKIVSQSGKSIGDGIKYLGGNPDNVANARIAKGDLAAFFELHIEQGGILEKESLQIGVVEGIVGICDWEVTIEGFANHAGTTPMNIRHDAMLAAARFIIAVNETATSLPGRQVGTVGKISALPGAYNVVPGKVVLGMEFRDLSYDVIMQLFHTMEHKADSIASLSGTKISFQLKNKVVPALTDKRMQEKIVQSAKALGLTYKNMQSGAGHDTQDMALVCPVGMIFVPSVGGISHSPKEFTNAVDMANGANVLLQTVLSVDKE